MLRTYYDEHNKLSDAKLNKMDPKYDPESLFLHTHNYESRFGNEESTDKEESVDLCNMPPLERDEAVEKGK